MRILVTGCTSGIGEAVARRAVARGWSVVGCARRAERLAALATELGASFQGLTADVTDAAALDRAVATAGPLDAVVANAGRGLHGPLLDCSDADLTALLDVNLVGVHRTVRAALPQVRPGGRIVIVSSICSHVSVPRMGAYCASKHALDAYATALRLELAGRARVVSVHPATTATAFFANAPAVGDGWQLRPGRVLSADEVADVILAQAAGTRRARRVFVPLRARLLATVARLLPGVWEWALGRALARMPKGLPPDPLHRASG